VIPPKRRAAALRAFALALLILALLAKPAAARGDLVIVGRLAEISRGAPHCGGFYFTTAVRYEVLRVLQGSYSAPELYAIHGCVEFLSHLPFKVGGVYAVTLSSKYSESAVLIDKLGSPRVPRFWALDIANAAPPVRPALFYPRE
jgi:hypothetical protein